MLVSVEPLKAQGWVLGEAAAHFASDAVRCLHLREARNRRSEGLLSLPGPRAAPQAFFSLMVAAPGAEYRNAVPLGLPAKDYQKASEALQEARAGDLPLPLPPSLLA
eukprot:6892958-Alexandrium_andersonii.AAC.1